MLEEFDFSDEKFQDTINVLPPKKQTEIIPEDWEASNRQYQCRIKRISKILRRITYLCQFRVTLGLALFGCEAPSDGLFNQLL